MGIEHEIKQFHFSSEGQKAAINLVYTSKRIEDHLKGILFEFDITPQQFNILRILRGSDPKPLSTLTIRERMLDRMSDTSRIVDRLVIKGLTIKKISSMDRRLVDVNITHEGKRVLEELDKKQTELISITKNLTDAELKLLNTLLDNLRSPQ